jgi:hypothetical protein
MDTAARFFYKLHTDDAYYESIKDYVETLAKAESKVGRKALEKAGFLVQGSDLIIRGGPYLFSSN